MSHAWDTPSHAWDMPPQAPNRSAGIPTSPRPGHPLAGPDGNHRTPHLLTG